MTKWRINRIVRASLVIVFLGFTLILSGCSLAILNPKGTIASDETRLFIEATFTMLIVVVPALLMTLIFAWRYSVRREKKAKYSPEWSHSTVLELVWWGIPCVIIAILATITWISTHNLDPYKPIKSDVKPITIQAIALNWKWLFIYPEQGIAVVNTLQFPVNTPISFQVTSDGPMNSLQIVQLAGQIYAMAGMRTRLHMIANAKGNYRGLSTNFSGDGFSGMNFNVHVGTEKQFAKWVNEVKHSPKQLTMANFKQLTKNSENNPVTYYSTVNKHIFHYQIMKFMSPTPNKPANMAKKNHAELSAN